MDRKFRMEVRISSGLWAARDIAFLPTYFLEPGISRLDSNFPTVWDFCSISSNS
jgi:hypothetical protein